MSSRCQCRCVECMNMWRDNDRSVRARLYKNCGEAREGGESGNATLIKIKKRFSLLTGELIR